MKRILAFIAVFLCVGCSPKIYPGKDYQRDSTRLKQADTLVIRDSVFIDRFRTIREQGDTVYITQTEYKYAYKYRDRAVHDTTYVERIKEVEKVIEKNVLTDFQQSQIRMFWVMVIALVIAAGVKVYRFLRR